MQTTNTPNYISLTEAANRCEYSQEYLSLRARQGKLKAVKQGRNWVTTQGWLVEYLKQVDITRDEMKQTTVVAPLPTPSVPSAPSTHDNKSLAEPSLSFVEKVRDELTFQPKAPTAWLEQEPEVRQSRRYLDLDILGSGGRDADDTAFWPTPVQSAKQTSDTATTDAVSDKKLSLKEVIAEETQKVTSFNFGMLRQAAVFAFTLLLLVEIGLIMRPMAANGTLQAAAENVKHKVALGAAVVTGQPLAFTWEQGSDQPIIASLVPQAEADMLTATATYDMQEEQDGYGQVAGATTERQLVSASFSQKVAAGVLVVIDSPDDGEVSPFGYWLADTFGLPITE